MNLKQKLTTGLATGAVVLSALTPAAFAATSVHVSGNGAFSSNSVSVTQNRNLSVSQSNSSSISNSVNANSNTGGNNASLNTGGNVAVVTRSSSTGVAISNVANANILNLGNVGGNGGNSNGGITNSWSKLQTFLTGSQEVGGGDPDGFGVATVKLLPQAGKVCVQLAVKNIQQASAAHIHEAQPGAAGPVVVALPTPNAQGFASGCASLSSQEIEEIQDNPSDYYVNVHNATYPGGAVRGQL
ncbi:MAG TPA: CHRD domain-containing protein [Candidatus Limnocylindrales bacterium]|nr:CHRD domain-containing protein [Candidatus Limnocylindrales bacterium]